MRLELEDYKYLREIGEAYSPFEINPLKAVDTIFLENAEVLLDDGYTSLTKVYDEIKNKCRDTKPYKFAEIEFHSFLSEIYKKFEVDKDTKEFAERIIEYFKQQGDVCVDLGKYVLLMAIMKGVSQSSLPTKTFAKANYVFLYNVRKLNYRYIVKAANWILKRLGTKLKINS